MIVFSDLSIDVSDVSMVWGGTTSFDTGDLDDIIQDIKNQDKDINFEADIMDYYEPSDVILEGNIRTLWFGNPNSGNESVSREELLNEWLEKEAKWFERLRNFQGISIGQPEA
ncbi:MAG: hypothetical protein QNJ63_29085 [Calothrix sp. MO_192.B10]|nr:hypothetical protein [Calothrix sp. MO_192.B10]